MKLIDELEPELEEINLEIIDLDNYWVLARTKETHRAAFFYVPDKWIHEDGTFEGYMAFDLLSHVSKPYDEIFKQKLAEHHLLLITKETKDDFFEIIEKNNLNEKQTKLKKSIEEFKISKQEKQDFLNLFICVHSVLKQGDGLVWFQVDDVLDLLEKENFI